MFVFANLLLAAAKVLDISLEIYMWVIIVSALLSWVNPDPHNPIVRFIYGVTEPVLRPIRRAIRFGPIDVSPIIAILAIVFVRSFVIRSLIELAYKMKGGGLL